MGQAGSKPGTSSWEPRALALPALLLASGAVLVRNPERGPAVLLSLLGVACSPLGAVICAPQRRGLSESWKRFVAVQLSDLLTHTLVELSSDVERSRQMLTAVSDAIRTALTNQQVTGALKDAVIAAARDERLQREFLATFTQAAVAASADKELRKALLTVTKDAVTEALADEGFMADMVSTISSAMLSAAKNKQLRDETLGIVKEAVTDALKDEGFMRDMLGTFSGAAIQASRDAELRDALVSVTKEGVADALRDEGFMNAFRDAMCESLTDRNIYRSAAAGVVSSLNPFGGRGERSANG